MNLELLIELVVIAGALYAADFVLGGVKFDNFAVALLVSVLLFLVYLGAKYLGKRFKMPKNVLTRFLLPVLFMGPLISVIALFVPGFEVASLLASYSLALVTILVVVLFHLFANV